MFNRMRSSQARRQFAQQVVVDVAPVVTAREQETVLLVAARYKDGELPAWGAPCRCPDCGDFGMAREMNDRLADFWCASCKGQWTLTAAAVAAHRDRRLAAAATYVEAAPTVRTEDHPALVAMADRGGVDRAASSVADAIAAAFRLAPDPALA